ncbi:MAG: putative 3-phenylpropionic acid transporter [Gammaproteobacteria bacterium]|nr:putative 3-phenylpropionic acid transporter [Gammaproteobacteria bacterium]
MTPARGVPHVRLSGFYFVYFTVIGALVPYFNPYLQASGYDAEQIGVASALLLVGRIVAPAIWGWLADRTGQRLRMVQSTMLMSLIVFAGVFWADSFTKMAIVLLLYGLFWSASLPQFEAITLNHLGERLQDYTRIRLWGSIGFIISAGVLGALLQRWGIALLPGILVGLIALVYLAGAATPPEPPSPHVHSPKLSFLEILRRRGVAVLFVSTLMMQLSCGPYYAFYTIFLEERGYSRTVAGLMWALGVAAEVALFTVMHRLLPAWGLRRLMLISLAAGILRWLMVGYGVQSALVIVIAQILHAATFGMHHAAAVQYVHRYFVGRHQGRGHALYSAIPYGVGGAVSALATGYLWTHLGPARTFAVAALMCAIGFIAAWRYLEDDPGHHAEGAARA